MDNCISRERITSETSVSLSLRLRGSGKTDIHTGIGFLDHMLTLLAAHARADLTLTCHGDTTVDDHHSTEDIGIALGEALRQTLSDKRGLRRYGSALLPMDEALVLVALDLSGRGSLTYALDPPTEKVGSFDTQLAEEFFEAVAREGALTLHIRQICGKNTHHILEAAFKGVGRALREAVSLDPGAAGEIPSTKGIL